MREYIDLTLPEPLLPGAAPSPQLIIQGAQAGEKREKNDGMGVGWGTLIHKPESWLCHLLVVWL